MIHNLKFVNIKDDFWVNSNHITAIFITDDRPNCLLITLNAQKYEKSFFYDSYAEAKKQLDRILSEI